MKSFFNDSYNYTPEAMDFGREMCKALEGIFDKWVGLGYSLREISYLASSEVSMMESAKVLRWQVENRKNLLNQKP